MTDVFARLQHALSDRYRLERELGQGGMATVCLAEDLRHHRKVALKVLRPELAAALGPERFLREIETTAQLTHPHILPLLDSGDADGTLFYVMPFAEGESLRDRLDREKQLPLDDALQIAREAADALSYAHSHGVIHRDIKPENILLESGHAVVADFGIARAVSAAGGERLTETGLAIGTPAYMSPEQAAGESRLDGRSDLYSLGCVLYEMLAGEPPFTGPSVQAVVAKKLSEPLPRISVVRETVPPGVEAFIAKVLARTPADRFATASEFAAALAHPETMTARGPAVPRRWALRVVAALAVVTALAVAAPRLWKVLRPTAVSAAPIERLAVLPLVNLMGDSAQNYLVDGVHDLLITELAKLPGLTVISRTSVMQYRSAPKPVREMARDLNADALVEGSVLRKGDSLLLSIQLIDGRTDRHLWAETYPRTTRDVLSLPPEAAQAIAQHLRTAAGPAALTRLAGRRVVDPQASDLYLKGRHFCWEFTRDGYDRGIRFLRQAVGIDPTFALAYTALAECYQNAVTWTFDAPVDAFPKAKAAIEQALALDSTSGEAFAVRGAVKVNADWDLATPGPDFDRALALSPGALGVHYWRSYWLVVIGRFDEAIAESRRAVEIDPLTLGTSMGMGWTYMMARRYDDAIAQYRRTIAMDTSAGFPHGMLAWTLSMKSLHREAVRECQRAVALGDPEDQVLVGGCGFVFGRAGRATDARSLLRRLLDMGKRRWIDPYNVAVVYEALGDMDEAFRWLERAVTERASTVPGLRVDPFVDAMRPDPRFAALLRRAGT